MEISHQTKYVMDILRELSDPIILGVYLFGSAVSGGLRPDSDVDILVVVNRVC